MEQEEIRNKTKQKNGKWLKFFKKYHKWLSIVFTIFIVLFVVSGIILNHRDLLSSFDVNRSFLPERYAYNNWNNAAVKSSVVLNNDSTFVYGNIGVWLSKDDFITFQDFNAGFPKGIDNRKIESMLITKKGNIYAGTLLGLYFYNQIEKKWVNVDLPMHEKRIVGLLEKDDKLFIMSRSELYSTDDKPGYFSFSKVNLPSPEDYDNKIGLFKTLWVIHSGEIYGLVGKLIVDLVGLVFGFLTITGLIYWLIPKTIKKRKKEKKEIKSLTKNKRWVIRWHNKLGYWLIIILIITTITGMFLRPPLLIPIANLKVGKIPFTELDKPNPWFDKLRKIYYDQNLQRYILIASDGVYYSDDEFSTEIKKYKNQPVLSVMGVNVFEFKDNGNYLIGSFSGLFLWNPESGLVQEYIDREPYKEPETMGPPIGKHAVTGYIISKSSEYYFDFDKGAASLKGNDFIQMPSEIKNLSMSLWNVALEVHTGRYYRILFGPFYILFIPVSGFSILFILISGLVVYWKRFRYK